MAKPTIEVIDDLPGRSDVQVDWPAVLGVARANPGKWAKVPQRMEPSVAGHINAGRYPAVPRDEYEAVSRNRGVDADGKRRADILVRAR